MKNNQKIAKKRRRKLARLRWHSTGCVARFPHGSLFRAPLRTRRTQIDDEPFKEEDQGPGAVSALPVYLLLPVWLRNTFQIRSENNFFAFVSDNSFSIRLSFDHLRQTFHSRKFRKKKHNFLALRFQRKFIFFVQRNSRNLTKWFLPLASPTYNTFPCVNSRAKTFFTNCSERKFLTLIFSPIFFKKISKKSDEKIIATYIYISIRTWKSKSCVITLAYWSTGVSWVAAAGIFSPVTGFVENALRALLIKHQQKNFKKTFLASLYFINNYAKNKILKKKLKKLLANLNWIKV